MNKVRTSSQRSSKTKRNTPKYNAPKRGGSQRSEPKRDQAKRGIAHKLFAHTHSADPMVHDEDHFEQDAPRMSLSKIFIVILLLHVLVIAGLIIMQQKSDSGSSTANVKTPEPNIEGDSWVNRTQNPSNQDLENAARASEPNGVPKAPPNVPQAKDIPAGWETIIVRSGDNLDRVANRAGIEKRWFVRANQELNLLNEQTKGVRTGQILAIPTSSVIQEYRAQERLALARGGETDNSTQSTLAQSNQTSALERKIEDELEEIPPIEIDQVEEKPQVTRVEEKEIKPIYLEPKPEVRADSGRKHTVAKGETFYGIGRKYGVSAQELMSHNGYNNSKVLGIGDVLKIP